MQNMNDFKSFYENIVENNYHYGTGSWSVINPNIKTKLNEFGEYYPYIKNNLFNQITDEQFNKIKKVTLLSDESPDETEISNLLYSDVPNIRYNEKIGYYLNIYAGYVIENNFRENATSGGFGTWIFKELLEENIVDGIIHVKQSSKDSNNILFKYDVSNNIKELVKGSKTKYYPVEFSEVLNFVKNNPGKYAFIGVPSFVMSLRLLQQVDSILRERIVFALGLICGHQKSTKHAESIAWQCGITPDNITSIDFRKKMNNTPANQYIAEIKGFKNGKEVTIIKNMKDLFGTSWGHGYFKNNASDFTDDVMNETADATIGDAWLPEYLEDSNGTNVIVTRNPIIDEIISQGLENGKIYVEPINVDKLIQSNASHFRHTRDELPYRLYKKDKRNMWRPTKRLPANNNISFLRARAQDYREKIARKSHIVYLEAASKKNINYYYKKMNGLNLRYRTLYKIIHLIEKTKKIINK